MSKKGDGVEEARFGLSDDAAEGHKAEGQSGFLAQLRAVLDVIPAYIWYAPPSGSLTFVNKRQGDFLGLPNDHPLRFGIDIGAPWDAHIPFLHPDDQEKGRTYWSNSLRTGEGYEHSYRVRDAQGNYRWLLTRTEPLRTPDGTLLLWLGATLDIEELKHAEEGLRESEYQLRQIFETVPAFLWSTDPAGEPTQLNQRMLDYTGMRFEDFKHGGWEAFLHPDDFPETARAFQQAIQTGTSFQAVTRLRRADGDFRWHHTLGEPLRDRQGRIVQWYGVSVDIDGGKEAEERPRFLAQLQAILNVLPAYTWYATASGALTFVNQRTAEYLGLPKDHPLRLGIDVGAQWDDWVPLLHPDDQQESRKYWSNCLRAGEAGEHSYRVRSAQGFYRWFLTRFEPLRASDGTLLLWLGTTLDIEEFKCAEQALRESEGKFRDYAESASDWFWETDPDHKFTRLTEDERRLARGFPTVSRIGVPRWEFATDVQSEPEKWELHRSMLEARQPFRDFVYRATRSDGSVVYNKISGKPVFDANGEFRGYRGTGADVTEIIRAQEALRESERRSRSALDGIAGLVAIVTPNGEIETVNRQCLEYFGRSLEEQKDWVATDMVHPEDLPHMLDNFKRAIASEIPYHFEQRLRRFDGEYRWFDTRGEAVRDDNGRVVRWYVLMTDIEDRTRALARLDQMQSDLAHMNRLSVLGELAASLSHEITQPIATARNNARAALNFLDKQPPDLDEVREALHSIVGDADRAGDIIDRIRDQIKKAPPRKSRFDLNEAIDEVIVLARSAITGNGVSARTRLTEALFPVEGDRVQLQQVVLNLILNAVEAMSTVEAGPRELSIGTERTRTGGVLVSVRDSGPGIDADHLDRIFQAFYTTKSSGVGMGLAICRSIIDAHGGRLWADANGSRGSVFRFSLPGTGKELTNFPRSAHSTGQPHEDTVSDAAHQTAYEGNRRLHRSSRGRGQRRRGRQ
jgi:PAS domain S-box-containing protein